ncbi:thioredoxin family protein [Candidatus Bathyarchaeota archaeon]|mgnify:FL=1|jgi:thioredoxin 1|nr:thioredoxin family protein [Candidatus Bathyarchaeota archaeon]MBT4321436.1 thioredoxin family protein [Candidatus Bathyarchaeota archaeon]MBT4424843.1 thioredoxin family protein [Candidatus Bathyarchaeota archaeon]MBT6603747.1 thioredoxin family protein [Candidatus Bathyarchaeota archaeon]MBT7346071.1 thioredoxin family protein [Candidatus Bathyarchaeota archaeon]
MPGPIDIQSSEWMELVESEERPVMVEYWHHKCVACKQMKPIYEAQPELFGNEIKFTRMNLLESKENRKFAIRGGVRSTPTFILYCQGRPVGQIIGSRRPDDFTDEIRALVDNAENCLMATPLEEE